MVKDEHGEESKKVAKEGDGEEKKDVNRWENRENGKGNGRRS